MTREEAIAIAQKYCLEGEVVYCMDVLGNRIAKPTVHSIKF